MDESSSLPGMPESVVVALAVTEAGLYEYDAEALLWRPSELPPAMAQQLASLLAMR